MSRTLQSHALGPGWAGNAVAHAQATSTGAADVKTLTAPAGAVGCFISVSTNNVWLTYDGETPSASIGLVMIKDIVPFFLPIGYPNVIKFANVTTGNALVNIGWVA